MCLTTFLCFFFCNDKKMCAREAHSSFKFFFVGGWDFLLLLLLLLLLSVIAISPVDPTDVSPFRSHVIV